MVNLWILDLWSTFPCWSQSFEFFIWLRIAENLGKPEIVDFLFFFWILFIPFEYRFESLISWNWIKISKMTTILVLACDLLTNQRWKRMIKSENLPKFMKIDILTWNFQDQCTVLLIFNDVFLIFQQTVHFHLWLKDYESSAMTVHFGRVQFVSSMLKNYPDHFSPIILAGWIPPQNENSNNKWALSRVPLYEKFIDVLISVLNFW